MSKTPTITKIYSYECAPLKTPKIKKELISSCPADNKTKDVHPHPTIIMDEYGQTPDHYYLARKPPPSFFQVKRKLDLQSVESSNNSKTKLNKYSKKFNVPKGKGKTFCEKPRYDTSLGQLTKKFLKLLSDASDGIINLNTACALLDVPKRRLYDITNVLEGAGLVQKTSRNNIQWMGRASSPCASVLKFDLERDIDILESKENKLDELIYHMTNEIEAIKETDHRYYYVTAQDLKNIEEFAGKTIIGMINYQFLESFERKLVISSRNNTDIDGYLLRNNTLLQNILHPGVECKENSYDIKIQNGQFMLADDASEASEDNSCFNSLLNPGVGTDASFTRVCADTMWSEGDTVIKNAFIAEEDDIAPMGKNFLLQTEDQDLDTLAYSVLDSPVDNYSFSLDTGEGLSDLFDCNFSCP
ncbi:transcription factor E2F2-like [Uloborus diversus]|uniref:transcription factor E2F2-like n=1 Tax=Uloborus diversus TaxID=327109 RepID=UPI0024094161|nr:transcription factor E2F2-like [Uloborus diversus]